MNEFAKLELARKNEQYNQKKKKERKIRIIENVIHSTLYLNMREWRKRNPLKVRAYRTIFVAKRNGSLKQQPCFCGELRTEAHHSDYTKPLEVVWLCKYHHVKADQKRRSELIVV